MTRLPNTYSLAQYFEDQDTRLYLDVATGRFRLGSSIAALDSSYPATLLVTGDGATDYHFGVRQAAALYPPLICGFRSRGSAGAESAVASGDGLLDLIALGHDGTDYVEAGVLHFEVDGAVSTGIVPAAASIFTDDSAGASQERFRWDSAGVAHLLGGRLKFPATQVPSSDANTLDDYEENTFTPVAAFVTPGTSAWTPSVQVGRYTKIGNRVWVDVTYEGLLTLGTAAGALIINNLPFTVKNVTNYWPYGPAQMVGWTLAGVSNYNCYGLANSTSMYFGYTGSGGVIGDFGAAHFAAGPAGVYIYASMSYEVN